MGELPLRGLLFLFGAFALVSAGLKGRATSRAGAGVSLLTLVEGLAGLALMASTVPGGVPLRATGTVGLATGLVVLVSTTAHLFRLRSLRRAREKSSGARLYALVNYGVGGRAPQSQSPVQEDAPGGDDPSPAGGGLHE